MTSKFEQAILKYFKFMCTSSGLVLLKVNKSEKRVQLSYFRIFCSSIWLVWFVMNYGYSYSRSFQGLEDIFLNDSWATLNAYVEFYVSFAMVVLFAMFSIKNLRCTEALLTKLLKVPNIDGFNHKLSWHKSGIIAFGEISLVFVYFINLFWFSWGGWEKIWTIDVWENKIINALVVVLPVSLAARCPVAYTLIIDFVRQIVVLLNNRIAKTLKLAESSENFKALEAELEKVSQLYIEITSILTLFEKSFGPIIVVLQCAALIIGVNQVKILLFFRNLFNL